MTHLSGILAVLWSWLRRNSHILLITSIAFFLRAIPHLFMIPLLAIEEDVHWLFVDKLMNADFTGVLSYPHTMHFLVAGIRTIFLIPPGVVETYINPILGALTILCVLFFLKGFSNVHRKHEIVVGVLVMCSEVQIYRSCVWQSTEILGVNILFLMLGFLIRRRWIPAFLLLLIETQTHYLSLLIGGIVFLVYGLLYLPAKRKFLLCFSFLGLGIIAYVFFPYTMSTGRFLYTVECFNPSNFTMLYSINDYFLTLTAFPVTIICLLALLFYTLKQQSNLILRMFGLIVNSLALLAVLFYNPLLIGPFRLVIYGSLAGSICLAFFLVKLKKQMLVLVLLGLSVLSLVAVYPNGLYKVQLIDKVSTQEEIRAVYWFVDRIKFNIANVATDLLNYGILMYVTKYKEFDNPLIVGEEIEKRRLPVLQPPEDWTKIQQISYIFWSRRMEKNAVTYDVNNSTGRFSYKIEPIPDIWCDSPEWVNIYNVSGVKIYERTNSNNK